MSEFASDERRDSYIAGLVQELNAAVVHGHSERAQAIKDELKRLGQDAGKAIEHATKRSTTENEGEFADEEHRAKHLAALKEELLNPTRDAEEIKAELERLKKPAKTRAEVDEAAAVNAVADEKEADVNPNSAAAKRRAAKKSE